MTVKLAWRQSGLRLAPHVAGGGLGHFHGDGRGFLVDPVHDEAGGRRVPVVGVQEDVAPEVVVDQALRRLKSDRLDGLGLQGNRAREGQLVGRVPRQEYGATRAPARQRLSTPAWIAVFNISAPPIGYTGPDAP